MKFVISLLLLLISNHLLGQLEHIKNDYIIKPNHDTVFGFVHSLGSPIKIMFESDGKQTKIKAYDLIGYKKGIHHYKVKIINDMSMFVKTIIEDKTSLYERSSYPSDPDASYIIEREGSSINYRQSNYIKILSSFFSDYKELSEAILNKCFGFHEVHEVVRLYNDWSKYNILIDKNLTNANFKGYSKGYVIIHNQSDTLHGYIRRYPVINTISYKNSNGDETTYLRKDIVTYSINNEIYRKLVNGKILRERINGKISLYTMLGTSPGISTYNHETGTMTTHRSGRSYIKYILYKQDDDKVVNLKQRMLIDYFSDNEYLKEKINNKYYRFSELESIVFIYNNSIK